MNKKRILVWTGGDETGIYGAVGALENISVIRAKSKSNALASMADADALITSSALWDEDYSAALAEASRIRWVQLINAGFDNVVKAGIPEHVILTTIGGIGAKVVAEHAVSMLLALLRRLPATIKAQSSHRWDFESVFPQLTTLQGRNVTLLGYGHIGRAITDILLCFEAHVTVLTRSPGHEDRKGLQVKHVDELLSVLSSTEVLIISVPLTQETENLIGKSAFAAMKHGTYLVNVARGRIIDTDALVSALQEGKVTGAALDVTNPEPLPDDHPLWDFSNVIISPHVAWAGAGENNARKLEEFLYENTRRFLHGETLENIVINRHI